MLGSLKENRDFDAISKSTSQIFPTQMQKILQAKRWNAYNQKSSKLHPQNKHIKANTAVHHIHPDTTTQSLINIIILNNIFPLILQLKIQKTTIWRSSSRWYVSEKCRWALQRTAKYIWYCWWYFDCRLLLQWCRPYQNTTQSVTDMQ